MIIKIVYLITKQYYNHNNDLKVKIIMYTMKKSTRLHLVVMMIRDYKFLIKLQHIHMEMLLKYEKVRY